MPVAYRGMGRLMLVAGLLAALGGAILRRGVGHPLFGAFIVSVCALSAGAVTVNCLLPGAGFTSVLLEVSGRVAALAAGCISLDLQCRNARLLM